MGVFRRRRRRRASNGRSAGTLPKITRGGTLARIMPSQVDPSVVKATVALKRSQTKLTNLRRQHLEGDYLPKAEVQAFVVKLAHHFRSKVLQLPAQLRAIIPGPPNFELEDAFDKVVDAFLREIAETSLTVPAPERGAYSTKPGPKPKRFNGAPKAQEAAE